MVTVVQGMNKRKRAGEADGTQAAQKKRSKADNKRVDPKTNVLRLPAPAPTPAAPAPLSSIQPNDAPLQSDWWDDLSKTIIGPLARKEDCKQFESFFKISRKTFKYICSLVKDDMMASKFSGTSGKLLSLNERVAVALRRLSSGEPYKSIGESFGINRATLRRITWRFVVSMEERGLRHLHWPSTEAEMKEIKFKFEKIGCLPNCCGALGTTRILMSLPVQDPANAFWLDHEKNYSTTVQAIIGPDMRFLDVVAGWPGSVTDSDALKSSAFYKLSGEKKRLNGKRKKLSGGKKLSEYIIGGLEYPLLRWLLTPYRGSRLQDFQLKFNEKHLTTRRVALRALARLKAMWKVIDGVMWRPDKERVPRIILACCLLHNIVIDMKDDVQEKLPLTPLHDSVNEKQVCESVSKAASKRRDALALHLSGHSTS